MSVQEIKTAVTQLTKEQRDQFEAWYDAMKANEWDRQLEEDAKSGRLDALLRRVDQAIDAGDFTPLTAP